MPTILTNALLSMGFSLVANFTNVVPVPPDLVPTRVDDVRAYEIGSGSWPVDINMASKRGGYFEIKHGVVIEYSSPTSLLHNQDPSSVERFRGTPSLDSKDVLKLAEQVVRRLARHGDPIAGRLGKVDRLRDWNTGTFMPFYRVTWPTSSPDEPLSPADIEIDARNGQIVSVWLGGFTFYDLAFSWEMRKRTYIPDPPIGTKPEAVEDRDLAARRPSTNQVVQAIESLKQLCEGLEAKPLTSTNLAEVDWKNSSVYTNDWIAPNTIVTRVSFTNGSWLDAVGTTACDAFAADACYVDEWWVRTPEQWFLFDGKLNYSWENLTQKLETNFWKELHIPKELLVHYRHRLRNTVVLPLGETGLKRILVDWTNGAPQKVEYRGGAAWAWQNHIGFSAEFDVETGDLKSIRFRDPKLIEALSRSHSNAPDKRVGLLAEAGRHKVIEQNRPKPSQADINVTLRNLEGFIRTFRIGLSSSPDPPDPDRIDSERTFLFSGVEGVYSNGVCLEQPCQIGFKDGSLCLSVARVVFACWSGDAAFSSDGQARSYDVFRAFEGKPVKRWQDLAKEFERMASSNLGLSEVFTPCTARLFSPVQVNEGRPLVRAKVCWCRARDKELAKSGNSVSDELESLCTVEFDLGTGDIEGVEFHVPYLYPKLWQALKTTSFDR